MSTEGRRGGHGAAEAPGAPEKRPFLGSRRRSPSSPFSPRARASGSGRPSPLLLPILFCLLLPATLIGQESYAFLGRHVSRGELTVPPTRLGELALTASEDRRLYAIAPGGVVRWRSELGGRATVPVAVAPAGTLATVIEGRELLLLDASEGREIWRISLPAPASAITIAPEGILLVQTGSRHIRAFSLSGRELWSRELRDSHSTEPILGPGELLYVGEESGRLTAFDLSGGVRWTRLLDRPARSLAATGEDLYLLEGEGGVRSYNAEGVQRRLVELDASYARLGVAAAGEIVLLRHGGGVELLDSRGGLRWTAPGAHGFAFTPNGVLLALPGDRAELRSWNGRLLWELQSEGGVRNLTYLGGSILVVYGDWVLSWYRGPGGAGTFVGWDGPRGGSERTGALPQGVTERAEEAGSALFRELSLSPREEDRRTLVSALEARVEAGRVAGDYSALREAAIRVALEPYRFPRRQGTTVLNDYPDLRSRAVALLGGWGDIPSRNALLRAVSEERSPEAVLSALEALARIPWDYEEATATTLLGVYRQWEGEPQAAAVTAAILTVLSAIETRQGEAADRLYRAILLSRLPAELRGKARQLRADHFENRE